MAMVSWYVIPPFEREKSKPEPKRRTEPVTKESKDIPAACKAARSGDVEQLKKLVKNGEKMDCCDYKTGISPIHEAARHGHLNCIKYLLRQGRKVDDSDSDGSTPLHEAASHGHVECLKYLLKQDKSKWDFFMDKRIDYSKDDEETPLMLAIIEGHILCVKFLLDAGADPNHVTRFGRITPLWQACDSNRLECVKVLLAANAHVNHRALPRKHTPLYAACEKGNPDLVSILLEAGADIRKKGKCQETPLYWAAYFGHVECLELLINNARKNGERFLKLYVNRFCLDKTSFPLYIAAERGHVECVKVLLNNGANANNFINKSIEPLQISQWFPLTIAVYEDKPRCVEILLNATNLGVLDPRKYTPINLSHEDAMSRKFIQLRCFFTHPLALAIWQDDPSCLRAIFRHGFLDSHFRSECPANLFEFGMRFEPAVLFAKVYGSAIRKCFGESHYLVDEILEGVRQRFGQEIDIRIFVLLFRLGAHVEEYIHKKMRWDGMAGQDVLHVFAIFKYLRNKEHCTECNKMNRYGCIEGLGVLDFSFTFTWLGKLIRMCLMPNFLSFNHSLLTERPRHQFGSDDEADEEDDEDKFDEHEEFILSEKHKKIAKQIQDSGNSLQHMCRVSVVFQLIQGNNYTVEAVSALRLSEPLQNYLLYRELGGVGCVLVNGFKQLAEIEQELDTALEVTEI